MELQRALIRQLDCFQRAGVSHLSAAGKILRQPHSATSADASTDSTEPAPAQERMPADMVPPEAEPHTDAADALEIVARDVAQCTACAELAAARTQTVFGVGNPRADLCFLGEAPGAEEDRQGEPFVGRAGQLLTDIIEKGMKLRREDVYIFNILKCRPPGNRNPLPVEADCCRGFLDRQIAQIQPRFICCLGAVAAQNLLQTNTPIGKLRGKVHDYEGMRVVCTYHPAYLLRNPSAKRHTWDDVQLLLAEMEK